jgi:hypothetical protein
LQTTKAKDSVQVINATLNTYSLPRPLF